jgi:arylsulfatase A-like enzyme
VNLVVYVSDALRTDHLGCYGARFLNTRTIDAFAETGVRFDQAISVAPWTCPSTTSIVTGLYPHHHGVLHWDRPLDPTIPTLFTQASAAGYAVGSFVFDEAFLFKGFADANVLGTSETLDGALAFLREHRDRPFLLVFHSWATHMPYEMPQAERREWLAAKAEVLNGIQSDSASALEALREGYRQAVERQSEVLFASFLDELDALDLRERTAVAFLADHGESWGERFASKEDVQGIYHMHGATVHDEVIEVPLLLSAPGRIEPGVVATQVRTIDLLPTLLELAGQEPGPMDGASLLPLVEGGEQGDRAAFVVGTDKGALSQLALRVPPWKLVHHVATGREEAYRLDTDPRERLSVPGEVPSELRDALYGELEQVEHEELTAEEEAVVTARLADLGYL